MAKYYKYPSIGFVLIYTTSCKLYSKLKLVPISYNFAKNRIFNKTKKLYIIELRHTPVELLFLYITDIAYNNIKFISPNILFFFFFLLLVLQFLRRYIKII